MQSQACLCHSAWSAAHLDVGRDSCTMRAVSAHRWEVGTALRVWTLNWPPVSKVKAMQLHLAWNGALSHVEGAGLSAVLVWYYSFQLDLSTSAVWTLLARYCAEIAFGQNFSELSTSEAVEGLVLPKQWEDAQVLPTPKQRGTEVLELV